jgi:cytochrome c
MKSISILIVAALLGTACRDQPIPPEHVIVNGDASRGKVAIGRYGCGACHDIPGIRGANGRVGPPLIHWADRRIIAGEVANTPDHLMAWITMPQAIEPGTAMPNMGISEGEARDIATYLYTLR